MVTHLHSADIAYSTSLTSKRSGVEVNGTSFSIVRLAGGTSHVFSKNDKTHRYCPIRSGKVQVKMAKNDFSIGQDGLLYIKAGTKCTISNKHYNEAVVYCFSSAM